MCNKVWKLSTFVRRSLSLPLARLALAARFCRFAISGWLSQAVEGAHAVNKKVALALLLEN